jgi:hypothetical protein
MVTRLRGGSRHGKNGGSPQQAVCLAGIVRFAAAQRSCSAAAANQAGYRNCR